MSSGDHGARQHVRANPARLAPGWQNDELLKAEVHRRIRALTADGRTQAEIALAVGCSSRTVTRVKLGWRPGHGVGLCGAPIEHRGDHDECRQKVTGGGRCRYHREKEDG